MRLVRLLGIAALTAGVTPDLSAVSPEGTGSTVCLISGGLNACASVTISIAGSVFSSRKTSPPRIGGSLAPFGFSYAVDHASGSYLHGGGGIGRGLDLTGKFGGSANRFSFSSETPNGGGSARSSQCNDSVNPATPDQSECDLQVTVPEPAAMALLASGLAVLGVAGLLRRRRGKTSD